MALAGVGCPAFAEDEYNPHNESFSAPPELLDPTGNAPYDPSAESSPSQTPLRGINVGESSDDSATAPAPPMESTSLAPPAPPSGPVREPRLFSAARQRFAETMGSPARTSLAPISANVAPPVFGGDVSDGGLRTGFLDAAALPTGPVKVPPMVAEVQERENAVEETKRAIRQEREAEGKRSTASARRLLRTVRRDR